MLLRRSYLYILLFTCLLTACVGDVKEKDSFSAHNSVPSLDQVISPIDKSAFYFIEIVDFLAQDTILLNRQTEAFFELVIRNLFTGKEEISDQTGFHSSGDRRGVCDCSCGDRKRKSSGKHGDGSERFCSFYLEKF